MEEVGVRAVCESECSSPSFSLPGSSLVLFGMGAAPGWEEGEFEFKLVFEEDSMPQARGESELRSADREHCPGERTDLEPTNTAGQYIP